MSTRATVMRTRVLALIAGASGLGLLGGVLTAGGGADEAGYQVAVYYFPGYHFDPHNAARGKDWTEWELTKAAQPRFPGHEQPKVPQWGYEVETTSAAMTRKIDAAADHGINAFIFDWYWYEGGPFYEAALSEGFLKAPNRARLKFALMWANHDWIDIFPAQKDVVPRLIYPGAVDRGRFDQMAAYVIKRFLTQPNYWRIDGKPYFSIYELHTLIKGLGGAGATRAAFDDFREKARAAGLPGLHLAAVGWGETTPEMVRVTGIDSVTSYQWIHHVGLKKHTPYRDWANEAMAQWPDLEKKWPVPYFIHVSMGWDNTPRFSWAHAVTGNTPAEFKRALEQARSYLDRQSAGPRVLTLNAWNEWTESSYLEPDQTHKLAYLEAVRQVLGTSAGDRKPEGPGR
jgi:hypothetical protein